MIAEKDSIESKSSDSLPNSHKVFVNGKLHPDLRVPFREISLAPTKSLDGTLEPNESVRVYDTSGPWGDPDQSPDVNRGLAPLRTEWIAKRGDTEEYEGRVVSPQDDGYLSEAHALAAEKKRSTSNAQHPTFNRVDGARVYADLPLVVGC